MSKNNQGWKYTVQKKKISAHSPVHATLLAYWLCNGRFKLFLSMGNFFIIVNGIQTIYKMIIGQKAANRTQAANHRILEWASRDLPMKHQWDRRKKEKGLTYWRYKMRYRQYRRLRKCCPKPKACYLQIKGKETQYPKHNPTFPSYLSPTLAAIDNGHNLPFDAEQYITIRK